MLRLCSPDEVYRWPSEIDYLAVHLKKFLTEVVDSRAASVYFDWKSELEAL
jgi:hypothetical protein